MNQMQTRRWAMLAAVLGPALLVLAGCAASPPLHWYQLRVDAPLSDQAPAPARSGAVWELVGGLRVPEYLDRETLVVASGAAGLQPLLGHRWAEPLRDSLPRLLLHDLALQRGADRVWAAPAPAGVVVERRLQVELLTLLVTADRRSLHLQARWWLTDALSGQARPPSIGSADLVLAVQGGSADAIAAAHRVAVRQLAARIAAMAD